MVHNLLLDMHHLEDMLLNNILNSQCLLNKVTLNKATNSHCILNSSSPCMEQLLLLHLADILLNMLPLSMVNPLLNNNQQQEDMEARLCKKKKM
jgi:hypothetical protein